MSVDYLEQNQLIFLLRNITN